MKRLFAAVLFTSLLHLLPAQAQPGKPGTAPAAKPPAPAAPDGRAPGQTRPGQVAVSQRYTGHLSADPAQFILDVGTMMLATNNNAAKLTGDKLRQLWGSNTLTSSQQLRIAELSQKLLDKKFRPQPHLAAFYAAIVGGKNQAKLSDAQLDQLLEVLGQSLERDPTGDTEKFLITTSRVLNGGYLYRSGFNSLRVAGGQFSFVHKGKATEAVPGLSFDNDKPAEPAPLPAAKPAAAVKPVAKAKPKPKPVVKKRASDGWDTGDLWSTTPTKKKNDGWGDDGWGPPPPKKKTASNDGWGAPAANDGWGAPAPKKKAPVKTVAKAPVKAPTAKPAATAAPANDSFDQPDVPFAPSVAAALAAYYPPAVSGPVIDIKDADIVMGTAGDSMVLHKVSGTTAVLSNRFLATGGKMDWTVKSNPVSAELGPFDFDLSKPEFTAQPVTLTFPYLFETPVKGALSYKAVRRKPASGDTGYPRFISLTNDVRLKNMGEGITYQGGLSMAGERLLSAALDGSLATITVQQEGKRRFRATSRNYVLGDSVISTTRAAVALYEAAHDSITHPGVELKYLKNKQSLKLLQEDGTFRKTPYSDSYHQVDVRAEMVTWNLREPKINFSIYTSPNQVSADFESKNFFSNVRYQQLKSINHLHPLQMLLGYSQEHGKVQTMSVRDVAEAVQIPEANLRSAVVSLARDGYVEVQPQTGQVTLLPKGTHYVGAAREKKDFDHIAIKSLTGSGRSATLNLNTDQMLVRGVEQFSFSDDSAAVVVRPDSGVVRIERNRNLHFSGRVVASAYRFKGKDFQFDYDGYYIDMPHIDSLTIRSKAPKKAAGKNTTRPTDFTLTNKGNTQSGRLFLNDPKNRSGRKKLGKYPAFNSTSGATVFFNKPDVLGGAYDSTTYFDVPPFKFDSMGTGKSRANVVGVFHSKALPPIKTTMTTQEDGSLGFVHTVPATGYALYGGKGKLSGGAKVRLNSQGLQSDGTVTYLGATLQSDRFVMYGDSLTGEGKAGAIAAGANFPKVTMPPGYLINWNAKSDSLHLMTTAKTAPVKMYADHTFKGSMLLTPKGLGGDGRLDGPQSYVRSESLTFKNDSYSGKKAVLSVKSAQAGKPALTANDTNFSYDLKNGVAEFKRDEGSTASLDLPYAGFRTGLSEGRWDFKKKRVTLKTTDANAAAYVASTRPEQKGLKFKATSASYDITKSLLATKGVPYIAAADAWIVPDSGRVTVAGGGKIQTLRRATVLLDSLERFHKLTGGNITVTSRDAFSGDARYISRTATGDSVAMKFTNFRSDSSALVSQASKKRFSLLRRSPAASATPPSVATTATASVDNNQKFQLAPSIGYRGGISLNSQKRGLIFDGQVQLQFGKLKGASDWFAVQDSIDPKNVVLTLSKPKTEDGTELVTGLFLSDADNKLYPRYAAAKATEADLPVLAVDGKLRYAAKTGEYTISKIDPADPKQYEGAVLTYNETNGRVDFRGPMNFIVSNKNYGLTAAGVGQANPDSARYQVDALLGFDINMTSKALDVMAANLGQVTKNGQPALDGSTAELYKIGQLAGNKATEAYASRSPNTAPPLLATVSPKLIHSLTLSRANLRWSAKRKAWHSVGKIGVAGINKRGLNALVDGYIEIKRENSTDQVEVYLEADPQTWYYIRYANNIVVTMSSSETYNGLVGGKAKGDPNTATEFGVFLGDYSDVDGFRSHFEREYLGKSGKLAARPAAPEPAPEVDTDKGKKKKKKSDDPFGDGEITPPPSADPTTDADAGKKSKKKKKDNDPFADGEIAPAAAEPAKKEKEKAKEKEAAPAADPTATPAEDTGKKSKKEKKKEAEAAPEPAADPSAEPTTDPGKKSKKKKKAEDDPFGDS
ncbi:MAG TPA: hypothetical protein VFO93_11845 [Hymenobacter sp.]|uniref:hypothetical protein n=1 Tax=Hymenobacter sp. TaxID=1898978 RepID=UPI002D7F5FD1|nr:hypothetical protein [Hymenobacter sp.]HET9504227.1 hypothetical protein [Hymenobacter sp.]